MRSGVSAGRSVRRPAVVAMVSIKLLLTLCEPTKCRKSRATPPLPDAADAKEYHKVTVLSRSNLCGCGNIGYFWAFAKLVFYTVQAACQGGNDRTRSEPERRALFAGSGYIV